MSNQQPTQDHISNQPTAFYEHSITHYESKIDSDHKTEESFTEVVKDGDSYKLGRSMNAEEFTRVAQKAEKIETSTQKQKLTGTTRATQDQHVETAYITTMRVYPPEQG